MYITYKDLLILKSKNGIINKEIYHTDKGIYQGTIDKKIKLYENIITKEVNQLLDNQEGIIKNYICGETINGGDLLAYINNKVYKFDRTNENHYNRCIGFANQTGSLNINIDIITEGECNQLGGLVTDNLYYAGSIKGSITNIIPTSGLLQFVGIAKNNNTLIINIEQSIITI